MTNKNYRRGYLKEREMQQKLQADGYYCTRSSGSHTAFDLIAINSNSILCIQIKRTKGKYYSFKKDIEQMRDIIVPGNAVKQLLIWSDYYCKWIKVKVE